MPRHLCIVARESSPLYGYLTIAFRERPPGAPTLDIVLDRRQANVPIAGVTDRRQHSAIDEALRTRGYAIFTGPGGGAPSRNDEAFIERAIGLLADVERRGPLALRFKTRRSALIAGLARGTITVLALALVVATVLRAGGVGRIATAAAEIAGSTVTRLEDAWLSFRGGTVPREARQADAPARPGPTPTPAPAPERSVGSPPSAAVAQAPTPAAPAEPARPFERTPPPAPEPRASVTLPPASRAPAADASRVPAGSAPTPSRDVAALESRALPGLHGLATARRDVAAGERVGRRRRLCGAGDGLRRAAYLGGPDLSPRAGRRRPDPRDPARRGRPARCLPERLAAAGSDAAEPQRGGVLQQHAGGDSPRLRTP
jgi:hypothetical protein